MKVFLLFSSAILLLQLLVWGVALLMRGVS